jgi:hypothetical protein
MPLQEKGSHVDQTLPLEIIRASLASMPVRGCIRRHSAGHSRSQQEGRPDPMPHPGRMQRGA